MERAIHHRQMLSHVLDVSTEESSEGELAAMVSYAIAFPDGFMALVDTYDVKRYFAFRQILSERFLCSVLVSIMLLSRNSISLSWLPHFLPCYFEYGFLWSILYLYLRLSRRAPAR